jgi:Fur family ferric uptake transcriptional regulator
MAGGERVSWIEHAQQTLEAAGYHRGGAREAVLELLAGEDCALTAQEIDDRLREGGGRRVGRASVYRSLELLAELKLVQRIELGDGSARFEAAGPTDDHHHHVVCESCGQIEPFHDPALERAIERLSGRLGYAVDGHEVVLRGACRACRN